MASESTQYLHPRATIFVLDWDDTLMPTTASDLQGGLAKTLPALVSQVDQLVAGLLKSCLKLPLSQVTILTNAEEEWVWASASFLPQTLELLRSGTIGVVSAHRRGENHCFEQWKDLMVKSLAGSYQRVLQQLRPRNLHVVAIGDCPHDLAAGRTLAQLLRNEVERTSVKTVRMKNQPTVVELIAQLRALLNTLPGLCATRGDVAGKLEMRLTESPFDMFKISLGPPEESSWVPSCPSSGATQKRESEQETAPLAEPAAKKAKLAGA